MPRETPNVHLLVHSPHHRAIPSPARPGLVADCFLEICSARDNRQGAANRLSGSTKVRVVPVHNPFHMQMLAESGQLLPHAWITGDDEMGRSYRFRRDSNDLQEQYLLAIPDNTSIRDLEAEPPAYKGQGTHPKVPFQRVSKWRDSLPDEAWTRMEVRDAEKGPLVVHIVKCRVCTRTERRAVGEPETLVVIRYREEGAIKHDYYLSNAPIDTPLKEFVRVAKAHHRIEHCIQRAKSEAGLADYQVRTWQGWHHHIVLSMVATWFLISEKRRGGGKWTPAITVPQIRDGLAQVIRRQTRCDTPERIVKDRTRWLVRNEMARFYHPKTLNRLPRRKFNQRK